MLWWTLRQLKSKDYETRLRAVKKLGVSVDERAGEPLVTVLKDEDWRVQEAAAKVLSEI
jgi:HEAT repeat protein